MRKSLLFIALCFVIGASLSAQVVSVPYFYGFEDKDAAENALWHLGNVVNADKCTDKWYRSSATSREGEKSMYISSVANGDTLKYGKNKNVVVAYREVSFARNGSYDITFDWRCVASSDKSGLFVSIYPVSSGGGAPRCIFNSSDPDPFVTLNLQTFEMPDGSRSKRLCNDGQWQTSSVSYSFNQGDVYYLAFVWVNNESADENRIAPAIDNLYITNSSPKVPKSLTVESVCDTAKLTWTASSNLFDIEYRKSGTEKWRVISNERIQSSPSTKSYAIGDMVEGVYDFRVRALSPVSESDTFVSAYNTVYSILVFCPENHCLNYIDLYDKHSVSCLVGTADTIKPNRKLAPVGVPIDYGYKDMYSRHTIHYMYGETDPRTGGKLLTVPPGELASVRVGNWNSGSEAEGIEYMIPVDRDNSILLLKYAIVFEDPQHNLPNQPYFDLELFDDEDNPIDAQCGKAEFYADMNAKGWNNYNGHIAWKDWTTIGFDLSAVPLGSDVKVRLTVQDCTFGAHYGYAYFTLGCASATIEGMSCGAADTMELKAPDGFDYAWFLSDNMNDTISKNQSYIAQSTDDREYVCHALFKENHDCKVELRTKVSPRFPLADFKIEHIPSQCENRVRLVNNSCVTTKDSEGKVVRTDEPVQEFIWTVNGKEYYNEAPEFVVDKKGGTLDIKMLASISGGCEDDTTYTYHVPDITTDTATINQTLCYGEMFPFCVPQQWYGAVKDTTLVCELLNQYGCDSVTIFNLTVIPKGATTVVDTTICSDEQYYVVNQDGDTIDILTEEGRSPRYEMKTVRGCDSIVYINLMVYPQLDADMEHDAYGKLSVCADQDSLAIPVILNSGPLSSYELQFDDHAASSGFVGGKFDFDLDKPEVVISLPENCLPGHYSAEVVLIDTLCKDLVRPLDFTVNYPDSIIVQKWNDVLAVTNETYNGGYTFSAYQWYKDGQPIVGETASYLYIGGDASLDTGAEYQAMLTRIDGNGNPVVVPTCPYIPHDPKPAVSAFPILATDVRANSVMQVPGVTRPVIATLYSVAGRLVSVTALDAGDCEIVMPPMPGVYILVLDNHSDAAVHTKITVH